MSEKNEKPTRKRLRDARKRGEVVHSRDVTDAVAYIVLVGTMIGMLPWMWKRMQRLFELAWDPRILHRAANAWPDVLAAVGVELVMLMLPIAGITAAAAVLTEFVQVRGVFSIEPIIPKFDRINPAEGFKRIFSTRNLFNLLKQLLQLILMGATISWVIVASSESIMRLMFGAVLEGADAGAHLLLILFGAIGALFLLFGGIDYGLQYFEYMKKMRMSKDEIRREHRDTDGNPEVKRERRRFAREVASSPPGDGTRQSSVLVVNPTHYAVALFYEPGETALPVVLEKGCDDQALFLRKVAGEAEVPIFEYPLLARQLFAQVEVSSCIPEELFPPVAEVLIWVRQLKEKT
ncbi:MAG TPA: type III secretion system export apparatus subunit SctU [Noviherbaspirillum sp.]|nr:type III secretion system export apparatus subunit SctU [Noviherbaspirillum sp.]